MTVSFTRGFASRWAEATGRARAWLAGLLAACSLALGSTVQATELLALRTERAEDGIYLSANVRFDLSPAIEEALLKGIALIFVTEAEIYRERWYWTDKRVASATRSLRLAYQPLARHWRLSQAGDAAGPGRAALAQSYDSLQEALAAIERISAWKIAEPGEVDGSNHVLQFRFRLDLGALPRPFQIGMAGQREWQISLERSQRLRLDRRPAEAPPADK